MAYVSCKRFVCKLFTSNPDVEVGKRLIIYAPFLTIGGGFYGFNLTKKQKNHFLDEDPVKTTITTYMCANCGLVSALSLAVNPMFTLSVVQSTFAIYLLAKRRANKVNNK